MPYPKLERINGLFFLSLPAVQVNIIIAHTVDSYVHDTYIKAITNNVKNLSHNPVTSFPVVEVKKLPQDTNVRHTRRR